MISDAISTGLQGMSKSLQGVEKAASDIARAGRVDITAGPATGSDGLPAPEFSDLQTGLTESVVELQVYEQSFKASAKVVEVAGETIGTLLDIET